jgi:riboflavin kinase/FMN adenylyltransferase
MNADGNRGRVAAVGFFDGVHTGHRRILSGADVAITFRNHPLEVLRPDSAPALIMDFGSRIAAIRSCGVREVVALEFTKELAETPAARFAENFAGCSRVRCGANWRFGRGGEGDAEFLRRLGMAVDVVPYADFAGAPVSSTRIRAALASGDIASANAMLGAPLAVRGTVFGGKGLGREIGFPTVNVSLGAFSPPVPRGVYVVDGVFGRGVANFGTAPTAGAAAWGEPVFEIHFETAPEPPPASGDAMEARLVRFIRPERRFDSLAALRARIAADCRDAFG